MWKWRGNNSAGFVESRTFLSHSADRYITLQRDTGLKISSVHMNNLKWQVTENGTEKKMMCCFESERREMGGAMPLGRHG